MMMKTQIKKFGNSKGVLLPASVVKVLELKEQDVMIISLKENQIILTKKEVFNPKSLEELFIDFDAKNKESESLVFDDVKGREVW